MEAEGAAVIVEEATTLAPVIQVEAIVRVPATQEEAIVPGIAVVAVVEVTAAAVAEEEDNSARVIQNSFFDSIITDYGVEIQSLYLYCISF